MSLEIPPTEEEVVHTASWRLRQTRASACWEFTTLAPIAIPPRVLGLLHPAFALLDMGQLCS